MNEPTMYGRKVHALLLKGNSAQHLEGLGCVLGIVDGGATGKAGHFVCSCWTRFWRTSRVERCGRYRVSRWGLSGSYEGWDGLYMLTVDRVWPDWPDSRIRTNEIDGTVAHRDGVDGCLQRLELSTVLA